LFYAAWACLSSDSAVGYGGFIGEFTLRGIRDVFVPYILTYQYQQQQQTQGGPDDPPNGAFWNFSRMFTDISDPKYPGVKIYQTSTIREYSAVTLPGIGILIHPSVTGRDQTQMLQHEYGHILDSQYYQGARFYFEIGIPSIWNVMTDPSSHDYFWTEMRANKKAERFFGVDYIPDPINYPTTFPK
jgi:hypothetical protein